MGASDHLAEHGGLAASEVVGPPAIGHEAEATACVCVGGGAGEGVRRVRARMMMEHADRSRRGCRQLWRRCAACR